MSKATPVCKTIQVSLFRGDRSPAFGSRVKRELDDQKKGQGPGPAALDCLLFAGHTGVSTDGGTMIFGFNPSATGIPLWQLIDGLKNGDSAPGLVNDDTTVFSAARSHGLIVLSFKIILPEPGFRTFQRRLDSERKRSKYTYGYPNGTGDCNCTTWLERLGLPLLSGSMDEFSSLRGISIYPSRRFGECV